MRVKWFNSYKEAAPFISSLVSLVDCGIGNHHGKLMFYVTWWG